MQPEGILLIDKPAEWTSFDVVARVRRLLNVKTVGHAGTLDPLATGLLVILVGRNYTRLSQELTGHDKTYEATIALGRSTTTDDAEGETVAQGCPDGISDQQLIDALKTFEGEQLQTPPQFCAVSIGGKRAYKLARSGQTVDLPPRPIIIKSLSLEGRGQGEGETSGLHQVQIKVSCTKGTYIRSLARDLGKKLGVPAHLGNLRRTQSGQFSISRAVPLSKATTSSELARALLSKG